MNPAFDKMMQADILTATPYRLHQMVVDGAVSNAAGAEQACQDEDYDLMEALCDRAREFIGELISGLKNDNSGPEFVDDVKSLFIFAYRQLTEGEWERNIEKLHAAVQVLRLHQDAWQELGTVLGSSSTASVSGPKMGTTRLSRTA